VEFESLEECKRGV